LEIECLPGDLIASIEVDVSSLTEVNAVISVADLTIPSGITVLSELESMIAKIEPPRLTTEEEEAEAAAVSAEPEVLTASKREQEE
jgi:large subunit ribosomal protein L25